MKTSLFKIALIVSLALAFVLPVAAQSKPADSRVQLMLDKIGQKYTVTKSSNFSVEIGTTGTRTQLVTIQSTTEKYQGVEIREIYSIAGSFPEEPDQATLLDLMT